jgi:cytochrome c peroxidase
LLYCRQGKGGRTDDFEISAQISLYPGYLQTNLSRQCSLAEELLTLEDNGHATRIYTQELMDWASYAHVVFQPGVMITSGGGAMFSKILYRIFLFFAKHTISRRLITTGIPVAIAALIIVPLLSVKYYHYYGDTDGDRGAVALAKTGAHGENFSTPVYLKQGWNPEDSLWFYNTTQGSALLPYDFFMALEQADSNNLFRANENVDRYRYLSQKPTDFNPDGLPVGFVKDTYKGKRKWYDIFSSGKDYVGHTCAACHTGQINYKNPEKPNDPAIAIRIDGGPAMADMVAFLTGLQAALEAALKPGEKQERFVQKVLKRNNNYSTKQEVLKDLAKWMASTKAYNIINHSEVDYGFARLDAFGRIYNRVLKYVISTDQARKRLAQAVHKDGSPVLTGDQVDRLFKDIDREVIIGDDNFAKVLHRLEGLNLPGKDVAILRNRVFNPANAPVSYPFLWDIVQSTYVQWNGLANNAAVGPLGRNTGEVIGVFGILDWEAKKPSGWLPSLAAFISGQKEKEKEVTFTSSIDVTNLERMERKLRTLQSPEWPAGIMGKLDDKKRERGRVLYDRYCLSCHEVVDRGNSDRLVVSKMFNIDVVGTDSAMAHNSVNYKGQSGNFKHTYQKVDGAGTVVIEQDAPVVQMLTAAASGVIATPDPDKMFTRRWAERIYNLVASLADNTIKDSVKAGNYKPNTTANPYNSLLSYKARSLNGIWATAPYLHNGSVPTLYDLLLPAVDSVGRCPAADGKCRPNEFYVGSREFDSRKIGFKYDKPNDKANFKKFRTSRDGKPIRGNSNRGHKYGYGARPTVNKVDGTVEIPALTDPERWALVEYLKSL